MPRIHGQPRNGLGLKCNDIVDAKNFAKKHTILFVDTVLESVAFVLILAALR